jgi:hypothetical protein
LDLRDKHDKVRAYIGEGEREVNRVTALDHATFSIISSPYRTMAATAQLMVLPLSRELRSRASMGFAGRERALYSPVKS